jgi:hypothetical protein
LDSPIRDVHGQIDHINFIISWDKNQFESRDESFDQCGRVLTNSKANDKANDIVEGNLSQNVVRIGGKRKSMKAWGEKDREVKNNTERKRRAENTDWVREMEYRIAKRGLTGELKPLSLANRRSGLQYNKMAVMGSFVSLFDRLAEDNDRLRQDYERLKEEFDKRLRQELEKRFGKDLGESVQ